VTPGRKTQSFWDLRYVYAKIIAMMMDPYIIPATIPPMAPLDNPDCPEVSVRRKAVVDVEFAVVVAGGVAE
jgi:hypothetical protein